MGFDAALQVVGGWGRFQKIGSFGLIPITTSVVAQLFYAMQFVMETPPFRCSQGGDIAAVGNFTAAGEQQVHDHQCFALQSNFTGPHDSHCRSWTFDNDQFFPTLTSQNSWVCRDSWRPTTIKTTFWIACTLGSVVLVGLADVYGRRRVVGATVCVYGVMGVASGFVTSFWPAVVIWTLLGACHNTVSHLPYVLVLEFCDSAHRSVPLLAIMASYTLSSMAAPLLAWYVWDWQVLAAICAAPVLLVALGYRWLPESASWLASQGRIEEAAEQLRYVARVNGCADVAKLELEKHLGTVEEKPQQKASVLQVWNFPDLRRSAILLLVIWMASCLSYFGQCQVTGQLTIGIFSPHKATNMFLSYLLGAAVEIPALSAPFLIGVLGRRGPLAVSLGLAGAASLAYGFLPQDAAVLSLCVALAARLFATAAYCVTLQYGPELWPTLIRGQGVALSEFMGGVAVLSSPPTVELGERHGKGVPMMIFGALSLVACFITLLLPETKGVTLANTLQEADTFCRDASWALCRSKGVVETEEKKQGEEVAAQC